MCRVVQDIEVKNVPEPFFKNLHEYFAKAACPTMKIYPRVRPDKDYLSSAGACKYFMKRSFLLYSQLIWLYQDIIPIMLCT